MTKDSVTEGGGGARKGIFTTESGLFTAPALLGELEGLGVKGVDSLP